MLCNAARISGCVHVRPKRPGELRTSKPGCESNDLQQVLRNCPASAGSAPFRSRRSSLRVPLLQSAMERVPRLMRSDECSIPKSPDRSDPPHTKAQGRDEKKRTESAVHAEAHRSLQSRACSHETPGIEMRPCGFDRPRRIDRSSRASAQSWCRRCSTRRMSPCDSKVRMCSSPSERTGSLRGFAGSILPHLPNACRA